MINICILVRNRYRLTTQSLHSLTTNTPVMDYNLVILDDGSEDYRVVQYLNRIQYASNVSVLSVKNSDHRLGKLKNLMVQWSFKNFGKGDWLYLSDNDVYFTPGWLPKLIGMAEDAEMTGMRLFGGYNHPYHQPLPRDETDKNWTRHQSLAGVSWLLRPYTWVAMNGLKEDCAPGVCQSEDTDFCSRMEKEGYGGIAVIRPHVVLHTGITNSEGKPAVGSELFPRVNGVLYE